MSTLKEYVMRLEGDGRTWNAIKLTAYMVEAIRSGVPDQVILDKTGLGTTAWYRKELAIGEQSLWSKVLAMVRQPDLCPIFSTTTALTTTTPTGMKALALIASGLPDVVPMPQPKAVEPQPQYDGEPVPDSVPPILAKSNEQFDTEALSESERFDDMTPTDERRYLKNKFPTT